MRILKIGIMLFLFGHHSVAQMSSLDYEFINSALQQVSKQNSSFFQLQSVLNRSFIGDDEFKELRKELKGKIDSVHLKEIIHNSRQTPADLELDEKQLERATGARLITPKAIDSLQRSQDLSLPLNKQYFYICSVPVFDNKELYAVIDFGGGTQRLAMQGQKYLFKKSKKGWTLIATFSRWVS